MLRESPNNLDYSVSDFARRMRAAIATPALLIMSEKWRIPYGSHS